MDPLTLLLLMGGGAILGGAGAAAGGADWMGKNANINTDYMNNPIYKMLFGGGQGSLDLNSIISSGLNYDPTQAWRDFMGAQPEMQQILSGQTGSIKSGMLANLQDFIKEATASTGSELSGMGNLYAGALGDIVGAKVGKEAARSNVDLSSIIANLYGTLAPNVLSTFAQGRMGKAQNALGFGGNMLGLGADLSSPVYQYQPGILDYVLQGAGLGLNAGSAFGMNKAANPSTEDAQSALIARLLAALAPKEPVAYTPGTPQYNFPAPPTPGTPGYN
jgi:hypothetical protein